MFEAGRREERPGRLGMRGGDGHGRVQVRVLIDRVEADAQVGGTGRRRVPIARLEDGDEVRVFNGRGDILLKARVDGKVQPGVVCARLNWAKKTAGFQSVNALTSEKLADMGNSATFYSVLVEVELSKQSS